MEVLKSVQAILNKVFRDSEGNSYLSGIMKSATAILNMVYDSEEEALNVCVKTTDGEDLQDYIDGEIDLCEKIANKGAASGYCPLGADSKVPVANMPYNALNYKGSWNATTNTPTLSSSGGGGSQGDYYIVGVAGTTTIDGISEWKVRDWIVHDGSAWIKVDNTELVKFLGTTGGSANAYTVDTSACGTLTDGQIIAVTIHAQNTGTSTLNSLNIVNNKGTLTIGELALNGRHLFQYVAGSPNTWRLINPVIKRKFHKDVIPCGITWALTDTYIFVVPSDLNGLNLVLFQSNVTTVPTTTPPAFTLTNTTTGNTIGTGTISVGAKSGNLSINASYKTVSAGDVLTLTVTAVDVAALSHQVYYEFA